MEPDGHNSARQGTTRPDGQPCPTGRGSMYDSRAQWATAACSYCFARTSQRLVAGGGVTVLTPTVS
eukprot:4500140-Prymnesium_polylepis.1